MKKWIVTSLAALLLMTVSSLSVAASDARLDDGADYLTPDEEFWITSSLESTSEEYDIDLIVVTRDDLQGYSPEDYANAYYDNRYYDYDAMLLLLGPGEGYNYILTNGDCYFAMDDALYDDMIAEILDNLNSGEYYEACETFVTHADNAMWTYEIYGGYEYYDDYYDDYDSDDYADDIAWWQYLLVSLVIGLVVGLIVVSVMKSKLKSVKMQHTADQYVRANSLVLTRQDELFLYSTTTRVAKPKNNSSSSGGRSGGGRSGGGSRGGRRF